MPRSCVVITQNSQRCICGSIHQPTLLYAALYVCWATPLTLLRPGKAQGREWRYKPASFLPVSSATQNRRLKLRWRYRHTYESTCRACTQRIVESSRGTGIMRMGRDKEAGLDL